MADFGTKSVDMRYGYASLGYVIWGVRNTIWFNSKNPLKRIFEAK